MSELENASPTYGILFGNLKRLNETFKEGAVKKNKKKIIPFIDGMGELIRSENYHTIEEVIRYNISQENITEKEGESLREFSKKVIDKYVKDYRRY